MGKSFIFLELRAIVSIHMIWRSCFHVITSQNIPRSPFPFESGEPGNEASNFTPHFIKIQKYRGNESSVLKMHCTQSVFHLAKYLCRGEGKERILNPFLFCYYLFLGQGS